MFSSSTLYFWDDTKQANLARYIMQIVLVPVAVVDSLSGRNGGASGTQHNEEAGFLSGQPDVPLIWVIFYYGYDKRNVLYNRLATYRVYIYRVYILRDESLKCCVAQQVA